MGINLSGIAPEGGRDKTLSLKELIKSGAALQRRFFACLLCASFTAGMKRRNSTASAGEPQKQTSPGQKRGARCQYGSGLQNKEGEKTISGNYFARVLALRFLPYQITAET